MLRKSRFIELHFTRRESGPATTAQAHMTEDRLEATVTLGTHGEKNSLPL